MKSRLDKTVWVLFFFFSRWKGAGCRRLRVGFTCDDQCKHSTYKHNLSSRKKHSFEGQIAPVQASVTQNLSGGTQSKKIFVFFLFVFFYFCHVGIPDYILWHCTVTQPVSPASPLCSHALIMIVYGRIVLFFISWSGASICFLGSFLIFCAFILKTVLIGLCIRRAGERVFAL